MGEMRMDRTVVKKMRIDSPEFEEANMCLCYGTPQECWDHFWDLARTVTRISKISGGEVWDFEKPIQRNVAQKIYRPVAVNV